MDDAGDLTVDGEDGGVQRAPVPLLEASPLGRGPADGVFLDVHPVRGLGADDTLQRRPEVPHAGGVRVVGVVGEDIEEAPAEEAVPRGHGGPEVGVTHGDDGEVGPGLQEDGGPGVGLEEDPEVGAVTRGVHSHLLPPCRVVGCHRRRRWGVRRDR